MRRLAWWFVPLSSLAVPVAVGIPLLLLTALGSATGELPLFAPLLLPPVSGSLVGAWQSVVLRAAGVEVAVLRWSATTMAGSLVALLSGSAGVLPAILAMLLGFGPLVLVVAVLVRTVTALQPLGAVPLDELPTAFVEVAVRALVAAILGGVCGLIVGTVLGLFQRPMLVSWPMLVPAWERATRNGCLLTFAAWGLVFAFVGRPIGPLGDALITLGGIFPGLLTGLALKRIVEAAPAPSEDVGATPEVPSGAPPVQ